MRIYATMLSFLFITLVAAQDYEVYVSSRGENAVKKYDQYGTYLGYFVSPSTGGLNTTEDILFLQDGTVLVSGFGNTTIKQYNAETGEYIGDFTSGYTLSGPSKMSIGPDSLLYVTQWGPAQRDFVRFDLEGNFVDTFAINLDNALSSVRDAEGNIFIALYGTGTNGVVRKFDADGNDLGNFVNSDILRGPTSIWFNYAGHLFVEDWITGAVLEYGTAGNYLGAFNAGFMTNPEGIAKTPDGLLLIGDWGQDVVHILDTLGNYLGIFAEGDGLIDPNSVKIKLIEPQDTTTAIAYTHTKLDFTVTPNFGAGPFIIQAPVTQEEIIACKLIATDGKVAAVISPVYFTGDPAEYLWQPEATLPGGNYFLQLQTSRGTATQHLQLIKE